MTEEERRAVNGESEAEERRQMAEEKPLDERKESDSRPQSHEQTSDRTSKTASMTPVTSTSNDSKLPSPSSSSRSDERFFGDEDQVDESVIEHHNTLVESGLTWLEKQRQIRKKEIKPVDHSKMDYPPFRKDFYIESKEIASMSEDAVRAYRENVMEGVKIRGKNCPKPIRSWLHCGLPDRIYGIIQKEGYKAPFPIQQQAIPAIMSGRDIIACAKTGSGKTLAFVLPMMRHVLDQPTVQLGEGPIAVIMAPTRELATQIYNECKKFCKPMNLRVVCVYGGASVSDQIAQLKRGAEIVVATPGRLIDMLACNKGTLTNLHRTTFVVLDEADRMFDMGFEPQVCLAGDTHVTLTHLLSRPISSLKYLASSSSSSSSSHRRVYGCVSHSGVTLSRPIGWCDSGRQSCLRLTLRDGRTIVCTPTHRIMTQRYEWVEARHLDAANSRILCSIDAIEDQHQPEDDHWQFDIGAMKLALRTDDERDFTFAFVRTLALYSLHRTFASFLTSSVATLQSDLNAVASHPAFIHSSSLDSIFSQLPSSLLDSSFLHHGSTPRCILREFLRTIFGQCASEPRLDHHNGQFTPITLTLPFCRTREDAKSLLHGYAELLSRFDIFSTISSSSPSSSPLSSIPTLTVTDSIPFGATIGFIHADMKSYRLAVVRAFLAIRQRHPDSKLSPVDFLTAADCVQHFASDAPSIESTKLSSPAIIPTFHLPIESIVSVGVYPTYDLQVSSTHSFLASNLLVHNCKIIDNVRPDRQTVLFSATFPRSIEVLAKRALKNPLEIIIGGRNVASSTITQFVEVREAHTKFARLLEILGKWYKLDQCILIFVDKQEAVDTLFRQLNDAGYPCAALHGGMDQSDRDFTIADFKSGIRTIMVATSIVARGLDVKNLSLVVNYEVPNHYEDYVHRVGRTGRAGKAGTAITFIEPDELKYAPDLVKGLVAANQIVPKDLQQMADTWNQMRKEGKVAWGSNDGFSHSHGYKFDEIEAAENQNQRRLLKMAENPDADLEELAAISEDVKQLEEAKKAKLSKDEPKPSPSPAPASTSSSSTSSSATAASGINSTAGAPPSAGSSRVTGAGIGVGVASAAATAALDPIARQIAIAKKAAMAAAQAMAAEGKLLLAGEADATSVEAKVAAAVAKAKEAEEKRQLTLAASAAQMQASRLAEKLMSNKPATLPKVPINAANTQMPTEDEKRAFSAEVEINDYPQHARWKVTHKGALDAIVDETECAVTTKGGYIQPGRNPQPGERKLHLLIEGRTEMGVNRCRMEIVRILEEAAADSRPESSKYAKYSVL